MNVRVAAVIAVSAAGTGVSGLVAAALTWPRGLAVLTAAVVGGVVALGGAAGTGIVYGRRSPRIDLTSRIEPYAAAARRRGADEAWQEATNRYEALRVDVAADRPLTGHRYAYRRFDQRSRSLRGR